MAEARHVRRLPERPLSPHLQIYRFTWTMAMSIAHRITGLAVYVAVPLLVIWIGSVAAGPEAHERAAGLFGSWFGVLVLIGLSWTFIHHAVGGIRHMVWDTTAGMDRASRFLWAKATLGGSLVLTALLWLTIFLGG